MTSILAGFRLKNPFCADNILCGLNSDSACPSLRAGEPVHPSVDQGLIDSLAPVLRPAAFEVLRNAGLPLFVVGTLIEQERPPSRYMTRETTSDQGYAPHPRNGSSSGEARET